MKRVLSLLLAVFMSMTAMIPALADEVAVFSTMPDYPEEQFVISLNEFKKNPSNFEGENVIEDDNMRYMINVMYERGDDDDVLKAMPVTSAMVENLIVLSPEQCKAHNKDEVNFKIFSLEGLQYAKNLEWLSLVNQQPKSLDPIASCENLKYLDIRNNTTLKSIEALKNLRNLTTLDMHAIKVGNLDALSNLTKLESLVAYSCALTDISGLSELVNMRYLDLGHNDLEDISALSKMNKLEYLDISRSMKYDYVTGTKKPTIKNIEALKEAENLKFLSMQSHDISDITPLKDMSKLNTLYANNNKISDWSPISGLNIKDIFSAGNPVFHTGEVNEYYYDFDNPDQDAEIKSKVVEVEKFEDIEVLKGTNAHDFLPETVGVRLEDIEVTEPEDPDTPIDFEGEYVNDNEIRFKVVDEKGNLITEDLNFTRSSDNQDGSVPDMEFADGYLSLKTHGVQRIISIGLNSEEYEMVNTHKYYEKYEWPSGNTIDYVEKSNKRVSLITKDEKGNYILNEAEKDVLIINLKKIGETPEEPDEPIVGEGEYVNDTEIRFKVVDEKGNLITKDLNFTRSSDNQDGSVPDMEFADGYLSLKTHGVQRIISIGLNSEEYEMVNTHKYFEKYEWPSGNTIDYVEKSNKRVSLITKDENGNYILNEAEKDVLIINLKKIGETPEEPDEPIAPSDNKTYANPENIVFKVVNEKGEIIKEDLEFKLQGDCEACTDYGYEFKDGYLKVSNAGTTGSVEIKVESQKYDLVNKHSYTEDYDWSEGKAFKYIYKNYHRIELKEKDSDGNYIIPDGKDNFLIIILKEKSVDESNSIPIHLSSMKSSGITREENNNNEFTERYPVTWDEGTPEYTATTGEYIFKGTLTTPKGVSNPDNLQAQLKVIIKKTNDESPMEDIIKVENLDSQVPEGYAEVIFKAGSNGKLNGISRFFVKVSANIKLSSIDIPKIVPNKGYEIAKTPWNPDLDAEHIIKQNISFTAQYRKKSTNGTGIGNVDDSNLTDDKVQEQKPSRGSEVIAGKDRIITAIEVSNKYFRSAETVVLARHDIYPDALSASLLAKLKSAPMLLNPNDKLDDSVRIEIERLSAEKIIIVGGLNSIGQEVENELKALGLEVERLSGSDRYKTSAAIAKKIIEIKGSITKAIIASVEDFPDALSSSQLAVKGDMPILLVKVNDIDEEVMSILGNGLNEIVIAGGENSISTTLQSKLIGNVTRLSGKDRYETAKAIAEYTYSSTNKAFIASGEIFADALVIGSVTHLENAPILLSKGTNAPKVTLDYLNVKDVKKVMIVGGSSTISNSTISELVK